MYQSLAARLHDAFWQTEGPPAELPLLRTFLKIEPGPALEIGCGSGRLLLPLLSEGFDLAGLDNSADMLALCRQEAESQGLTPTLHQGDLSKPFPTSYQSLAVPAFTLQLASDPLVALANLTSHLLPGGLLYLTLFVPHAELAGDPPPDQWFSDRGLTLSNNHTATLETLYHLQEEQRHLHRRHHYRLLDPAGTLLEQHRCEEHLIWLYPDEAIATLQAMNFDVLEAFPDFNPQETTPLEEATVFTLVARLMPDAP